MDIANALVVDLTVSDDEAALLVTSSGDTVTDLKATLDATDTAVTNAVDRVAQAQSDYDTKLITEITYTDNGLTATVYNDQGYGGSPPLGVGTIVDVQEVAQIDFQWGGGYILGTNLYEDTQIKFEGTLTTLETKEYYFYGPADDGFILRINGVEIINDWYDKGGGGSVSQPVLLTEGVSNTFEAWFYENGGGAWVQLNWYDNGWKVIPASAFNTPQIVQTKDPNLLIILEDATEDLALTIDEQAIALSNLNSAISLYNDAVSKKEITYNTLQDAVLAIPAIQQSLLDIVEAKKVSDELARLAAEEAAKQAAIIESTPIEEPIVEPTTEPTMEPTISPTQEPTPEPTPSEEPTKEPEENEPEPLPEPEQTTTTELPVTEAEAEAAIEELATIDPEELTDEQAVVLLAAAELVLETAVDGSPEYEAALDALAVVAQADDPQLPAELASIPGAEAVLDTLNALGNMGADMSPATREEAEKIIVAGVVAVNAALGAIAVPSAPAAPAGGSSGGAAASGSGSARRKV